jgi:WD40 repeat protein
MAVGSEDKCAYLFDVRKSSGTYLAKLGGHADVVTDVAFNPLHPQLATSAADGRVRAFADQE